MGNKNELHKIGEIGNKLQENAKHNILEPLKKVENLQKPAVHHIIDPIKKSKR
jgi:hypothetical protein